MATRCIIGMTCPDGKVRGVYCHFDGYPGRGGAGETLLDHYTDFETASQLLALGDLSSLGDSPMPGSTVAYHRDRGEEFSAPYEWESPEDFFRCFSDPRIFVSYVYHFDSKCVWHMAVDGAHGWELLRPSNRSVRP